MQIKCFTPNNFYLSLSSTLLGLRVFPLLVQELRVEENEGLADIEYDTNISIIGGLSSVLSIEQIGHLDVEVLCYDGDLSSKTGSERATRKT